MWSYGFRSLDISQCDPQWNRRTGGEGEIETEPNPRDTPDRDADGGQHGHGRTHDQAALNDPLVANRIANRAGEQYRKHNMRKGEPIMRVEHKGILRLDRFKPVEHL